MSIQGGDFTQRVPENTELLDKKKQVSMEGNSRVYPEPQGDVLAQKGVAKGAGELDSPKARS